MINSCRLLLSIITHVTTSGIVLNKKTQTKTSKIKVPKFANIFFELKKYFFIGFLLDILFVEHYIVNL